ncbi:MAG: Gfo/Idh/MocA family oxidoreductase [Planctomycetaceae bacterium]|nr:Gfo/Idh/MocA family oxidoreductase [Planctomycetaceae bacterium]
MSDSLTSGISRRNLLKASGTVAAASALASLSPSLYAAEDNNIRVALVGCGGRGTGAASQAMSVPNEQIKLVAMADVFDGKLSLSHNGLKAKHGDQVDVPEDRRFIGFDAYKEAMDALKPGDVVILTTPPAFRWVQYSYAIEKGLNVFMEKPVTVDGPTTRKMLALNEQAKAKNLKVGVGLMCRHCKARGELFDRIQDGQIGDVLLIRAYRMLGPTGNTPVKPNPGELSDLLYQIKNFHGFLWLSGGAYSDFLIHNIDEGCWMKNDFPVEAIASGGRHYRGDDIDQNFDSYSVEYTFADGTKMMLEGRTIFGCHQEFATFVHGSKGSAICSTSSHMPAKSRIFKNQRMVNDELVWEFPQPEPNPYQLEWNDLIEAIRNDLPYNEVERGAKSSLVTSMGRMAAHTGQLITYDQILNLDHEFAPDIDKLTLESDSPLMPNAEGKYPVPQPGLITKREYQVL